MINEHAYDLLIKGVSVLGRAKLLQRTNKIEAIYLMKKGIRALNDALLLDPSNFDFRKVRLRHFHGISKYSPVSLLNIVKIDLDFFYEIYSELSIEDKGLFNLVSGDYYFLSGDNATAKKYLVECKEISPDSIEASEADETLQTIYQNI